VLDALVGAGASASTKEAFRRKLRTGELDDKEIEIEVQSSGGIWPAALHRPAPPAPLAQPPTLN
jgi:ATP-dependent HslUV protease ATP-binding subunit HslU